jgi:uroporphyrinogen-III synthase
MILVTRPEPGATETSARVIQIGFVPLMAPSLVIEPTDARLPKAESVAAVLVTSGNALAPCFPAYQDTPLLTVGDATAARARQLGFRHITSAGGDAADLATLVIRDRHPQEGPLLLACARGQGAPLAAALRLAGFRVIRRVVYQSVAARTLPCTTISALRTGQVRAALFFSAATAGAFIRLIRQSRLEDTARSMDALAIGKAAGMALKALPWRRVGVAEKPTQDAMLALIQ